MRLIIKCIIIALAGLFVVSFCFDKEIDYTQFKYIRYDDFEKIEVRPELIDLTEMIEVKKVKPELVKQKDIFRKDEKWITEKYESGKRIEGKDGVYIFRSKKFYFTPMIGFIKDTYFNRVIIKYNDSEKGLILPSITERIEEEESFYKLIGITYFSKEREEFIRLFGLENIKEYRRHNEYRLLDVKGEWFLVLEKYIAFPDKFDVDEYYIRIYKYNIKTKQIYIWDSQENDRLTVVYGFSNYDLSRDRRYVYMSAYSNQGYSRGIDEEHIRKSGLFIYDWHENKLYKVIEGFCDAVVNNTDDGYCYYMNMGYDETGTDFINYFYRFPNPEEILNKY
jgi:hypothetical protein